MTPQIVTHPDAAALAADAAGRIAARAAEAIAARGRFTLALSGGSTPEKTYALLAQPPFLSSLDWSRIFLFFGDERCVPPDDPRSNDCMARRSLLAHVPGPPANVFPIPTDSTPAQGAASYAQSLASVFAVPSEGPPPVFDLILLGLGDDGHT